MYMLWVSWLVKFQIIRRLFQPFGRSKNSDDVVRTELNFGKRKSVSEVFAHFLRYHTSSIALLRHLLNWNAIVYLKYFHQGSIRRRPLCLNQTKKTPAYQILKTTLRIYFIHHNAKLIMHVVKSKDLVHIRCIINEC